MTEGKWVGSRAARVDAPDKASGRAVYIHDLSRPGMLFGKIKFSAHAHAKIVRIDTSRAKKLPGVRAVITAYDSPEVRLGFLRDNFALKKGKVRAYRDEIAAVAAIDPDIAAEAIELIDVEYEPLPCVFSPEEAMREGATLIHEVDAAGRPVKSNVLPLVYHHLSGDLDAQRKASKWIVEGEYSTPMIQQTCMGTAGCIAEFDGNQNLTIWAKTQIPFLAQKDFVRALEEMGLSGKNARVLVPALGGGFGTGLDTHAYEFIAILLAHRTGKPVKIVYTREEEFANLSPRQGATVRIRHGCDERGRLTFREIDVMQDNGAYASWGATYPSVMMLPATSLYKVKAARFDATLVYTNNTYCQAMRGYGNPEVTWPVESALDDLAERASIDPLDLRLLNCNEPNEITPMGLKISTCGLRQCLEATGKHLSWKEKRGNQKGKRRGVGLASLMHVGGSGRIYRSDASGIILKLDDFGNVNVSYGGVEMGQGLHSAIGLMVADALGVKPDKVHVNGVDTGTCPWDVGTHASRGAFMAGNCVIAAAEKARARIFELAEEIFPAEVEKNLAKTKGDKPAFDRNACTRDRFELRDGWLFLRDAPDHPALRIDLARFVRAVHFRAHGEMFTVTSYYDPPTDLPDWTKGMGNMSATYAYGTQGFEVEVDEDTGDVKILRAVAAHDVGKVLNRQTIEGQVYGGLVQGIGYALTEEVRTREGRTLNPGFRDYKIPTIGEIDFPIDVELVEIADAYGPFGSKGIGEPGLVPTAPALSNAIYDAIGVRIHHLPITPEKILAALQTKKREGKG